MEKFTVFHIIKSLQTKEGEASQWSADVEVEYNPFLVNVAFSLRPSSIFIANEANKLHALTKKQQYDFYNNLLVKGKLAYVEWPKSEKGENLDAVMQYFNYSRAKAQIVLNMLSADQIDAIKQSLAHGGKS